MGVVRTVRGSVAFSFSLRPAAAENSEAKAGHLDPTGSGPGQCADC
jgi:hypothetical protein